MADRGLARTENFPRTSGYIVREKISLFACGPI